MKTTDFCPTRHYEDKEFYFTADGEKKVVEGIALLIRGRNGRARIVKARGKDIYAVYSRDDGHERAKEIIENFQKQYATPEAA